MPKKEKLLPVLLIAAMVITGRILVPAEVSDPARDKLPPSILPVIILSGSDYEMGYQYGQQAAAYIEKTKESSWASALQQFSRT